MTDHHIASTFLHAPSHLHKVQRASRTWRTRGDGSLTASGELIGSPEYMSPEQGAGSADLDHRTDIYSWGIVAFELLTGNVPFLGETVSEVVFKHMKEPIPDISRLRPEAPEDLVAVVQKSLEKEPASRWDSMREAMRALPRA